MHPCVAYGAAPRGDPDRPRHRLPGSRLVPAIEDLDPLLRGVGVILVVLGLIIVVATGRTLSAEEKRIGPRV